MKIYAFAIVATILVTFNSLAEQPAVDSDNNYTNSYLSGNGVAGMCRGGLHIVSAPLLIPITFAYGIDTAFKDNQETGRNTHDFLNTTKQIMASPMFIAVNVAAGVGGCVLETLSGLFDVLSFGNYDLPKYDKYNSYDTRPYYIRLIKDDEKDGSENDAAESSSIIDDRISENIIK